MAKYFGNIGFVITEEKPANSGIWRETVTEIPYFGDFVKRSRKLEITESVNDNVNLSNDISILSDPFARENFHAIRYAEYLGTKWRVSNVEIQFPRLILTMGGIYHEDSYGSAQ